MQLAEMFFLAWVKLCNLQCQFTHWIILAHSRLCVLVLFFFVFFAKHTIIVGAFIQKHSSIIIIFLSLCTRLHMMCILFCSGAEQFTTG